MGSDKWVLIGGMGARLRVQDVSVRYGGGVHGAATRHAPRRRMAVPCTAGIAPHPKTPQPHRPPPFFSSRAPRSAQTLFSLLSLSLSSDCICFSSPLLFVVPSRMPKDLIFFFLEEAESEPLKEENWWWWEEGDLDLFLEGMAAQEQEQEKQQAKTSATSSLPTSSERSSSSAPSNLREGGAESDEEIRRVPEIGSGASASSAKEDGKPAQQVALAQGQPPAAGKKRGRTAGDKEQNRLKRLLRNRVSAQQARERKKAYLTELEAKAKDLELRNAELEQRVSTLQNENNTLRQILKNTMAHTGKRAGGGGGAGAKGEDGGMPRRTSHIFMKLNAVTCSSL